MTTPSGLPAAPLAQLESGQPVPVSQGGTGGTTSAAGYNALSPMTTIGDIEYESAAGIASRLAGNTTSQPEYLQSQGAAGTATIPKWSTVSGQFLCAPNVYAPGASTQLSVAGTVLAAFGSGTASTNTFIAPASGSVLVEVSCALEVSSGGSKYTLGLAPSGSVSPIAGPVTCVILSTGAALNSQVARFPVSSLTPGSAYQYDLVGAASAGSVTIFAFGGTGTTVGNSGAPVIMTVQAV